MFTTDLYSELRGDGFDLMGPDGRLYPTRVPRLPIISAKLFGTLFVLEGSVVNPFLEEGKGPAVLEFHERWAEVGFDDVQAIIDATPVEHRTPVRVIDGADLNRRVISPGEEPAILFHLGATEEGLAVAQELGFHKCRRVIELSTGERIERHCEVVLTMSAVAYVATGPLAHAVDQSRPRETNPTLKEALEIVRLTGQLPERTPVSRRTTNADDDEFVALLKQSRAAAQPQQPVMPVRGRRYRV